MLPPKGIQQIFIFKVMAEKINVNRPGKIDVLSEAQWEWHGLWSTIAWICTPTLALLSTSVIWEKLILGVWVSSCIKWEVSCVVRIRIFSVKYHSLCECLWHWVGTFKWYSRSSCFYSFHCQPPPHCLHSHLSKKSDSKCLTLYPTMIP